MGLCLFALLVVIFGFLFVDCLRIFDYLSLLVISLVYHICIVMLLLWVNGLYKCLIA